MFSLHSNSYHNLLKLELDVLMNARPSAPPALIHSVEEMRKNK